MALQRRQAATLLGANLFAPGLLRAQSYPAKPITWVVPFPPGGVTDTTARLVGRKMGELLGQQIVVDNKPGAGGAVGTEYVARAAPDGYTVLYGTQGTLAANLALYPALRYDPARDFVPVHGMLLSPLVLVVEAAKPWKTVEALVRQARDKPGTLNYASAGNGTATHLTAELFATEAGVKLTHVPYKGSAPGLQDLMGGRMDLMFDYIAVVQPHVQAGRLRALAVMSDKRVEALPTVPTIVEAGLPGAQSSAWSSMMAPAGTPAPVVARLADAMHASLSDKALIQPMVTSGSVPMLELRGEEFRKFIALEQRKWAEVVRRSGAKIE
jgi:tripartite-type tricarboxylate transporter receptor subunit TctC